MLTRQTGQLFVQYLLGESYQADDPDHVADDNALGLLRISCWTY
jgi:hypothetical protein